MHDLVIVFATLLIGAGILGLLFCGGSICGQAMSDNPTPVTQPLLSLAIGFVAMIVVGILMLV